MKNVTIKFSVLLIFINVLLAAFLQTKDSLDGYISIILPMILISVLFLCMADYFGTNQGFVFANVILMNIGASMQVLVGKTSPSKYILLEVVTFILALFGVMLLLIIQQKCTTKTQIIICIAGIVSLYLILMIFGSTVNGTKAWIKLGSSEGAFSFQLTEIIKVITIYLMSVLFENNKFKDSQKVLLGMLTIILNAIGLLLLRELGTLVILTIIFLLYVFLYVDKVKLIAMVTGGIVGVGGIMLGCTFVFSKLYEGGLKNGLTSMGYAVWRKICGRIQLLVALDEADPMTNGYQPLAARNAITLGGWFGSPYNVKIPVEESDYVYPALLCNMGFLIGVIVLILFLSILFIGTDIILKKQHMSEQVLAMGFLYAMVLQSLLTIFGSSNFFLLIGLPIAWLSAGGTNQLVVFAMILYIIYVGREKDILLNKKRKPRRERICRIVE